MAVKISWKKRLAYVFSCEREIRSEKRLDPKMDYIWKIIKKTQTLINFMQSFQFVMGI